MSDCSTCKHRGNQSYCVLMCGFGCGFQGCAGWEPTPTTKGDKVRSMSDEEIAEFQVNIEACCRPEDLGRCIDELYSRGEGPYVPPEQCRKCWLDWLKEEVKE